MGNCMRTVLVTLIGPDHTADLVVDADTTVGELSARPEDGVQAHQLHDA
jgi:hypothetical protein